MVQITWIRRLLPVALFTLALARPFPSRGSDVTTEISPTGPASTTTATPLPPTPAVQPTTSQTAPKPSPTSRPPHADLPGARVRLANLSSPPAGAPAIPNHP